MFWLDKLPTEPLLRKECGFVKLKFVDRVKMSQQDLHAIIRRSVAGGNIFSNILDAFQHESVNTIDACRRVNQQKGVLWELLCVEYLRHVGYSSVLRFEDVDTALKSRLGLRDRDMGIDIAVFNRNYILYHTQKQNEQIGLALFPWSGRYGYG